MGLSNCFYPSSKQTQFSLPTQWDLFNDMKENMVFETSKESSIFFRVFPHFSMEKLSMRIIWSHSKFKVDHSRFCWTSIELKILKFSKDNWEQDEVFLCREKKWEAYFWDMLFKKFWKYTLVLPLDDNSLNFWSTGLILFIKISFYFYSRDH